MFISMCPRRAFICLVQCTKGRFQRDRWHLRKQTNGQSVHFEDTTLAQTPKCEENATATSKPAMPEDVFIKKMLPETEENCSEQVDCSSQMLAHQKQPYAARRHFLSCLSLELVRTHIVLEAKEAARLAFQFSPDGSKWTVSCG